MGLRYHAAGVVDKGVVCGMVPAMPNAPWKKRERECAKLIDGQRYGYNADRQLTSVARPDGSTVAFTYDGAGRVSRVSAPGGDTTFGYDQASGALTSGVAPSGEHTDLTLDGPLPTSETLSGPVSGRTSRTYGPDFRIASSSVNGGSAVGYFYDRDGLLTGVGSFSLSRDPANGLVTATTLGNTATAYSYNEHGEPQTYATTFSGQALFNQTYTRDGFGRITQKTETGSDGQTHTFSYTYDAADRLADVRRDGSLIAHYDYDANGNRTAKTSSDGAVAAGTYDAQDRLTRYGTTTYDYNQNGDLASKTDTATGARTSYGYDGLGSTRFLTGTNGAITDTYAYDAYGTQIASTGATTNFYLFAGEQRELDLGMIFLRDRFLKSEIGRFLTTDRYQGRRNVPLTLHRYLYVHGDPVNHLDPSGKDELAERLTVSAIQTFVATLIIYVTADALRRSGGLPVGLFDAASETGIEVKTADQEIQIDKMGAHFTAYPFREQAKFASSDEDLAKILRETGFSKC